MCKNKFILPKNNEVIHIINSNDIICLNCRKSTDHGWRDCPQNKIKCLNCGNLGHYKRDCHIYKKCCFRCSNSGKIILKENCKDHYKQDTCGTIILNKDNSKILLVKGDLTGIWGCPKGLAEKNESSMHCAMRETMEETGLLLDLKDCKKINIKGIIYYMINIDETLKIKPTDEQEISDASWFNIKNLKKNKNKIKINQSLKKIIDFYI